MNADNSPEPDDSGESVPRHSLVDRLAVAPEQRRCFVDGEEVPFQGRGSSRWGRLGLSCSPAGRWTLHESSSRNRISCERLLRRAQFLRFRVPTTRRVPPRRQVRTSVPDVGRRSSAQARSTHRAGPGHPMRHPRRRRPAGSTPPPPALRTPPRGAPPSAPPVRDTVGAARRGPLTESSSSPLIRSPGPADAFDGRKRERR
jgi:hypothetical protein